MRGPESHVVVVGNRRLSQLRPQKTRGQRNRCQVSNFSNLNMGSACGNLVSDHREEPAAHGRDKFCPIQPVTYFGELGTYLTMTGTCVHCTSNP
jgi:hypothetical protein